MVLEAVGLWEQRGEGLESIRVGARATKEMRRFILGFKVN